MNTAPKDAEAVPLPDLSYAGEIFGAISDWAFCAPGPAAGGLATKMYEVLNKAFRAYGDAREAAGRDDERARLAAQQPAQTSLGVLIVSDESLPSGVATLRDGWGREVGRMVGIAATPPTHAQVDAAPHDSAETRDAAREALKAARPYVCMGLDYQSATLRKVASDTLALIDAALPTTPTASPASAEARTTCERCKGRGYFDISNECGRCDGAGREPARTAPEAIAAGPIAVPDFDMRALANRAHEGATALLESGPMTEAPEVGTDYWATLRERVSGPFGWIDSPTTAVMLARRQVFATEAAALHSLAGGK